MKAFRKLKKFRVLVGTPHADRKNYCFDDFLIRLKTLTYDHYDALIADNSNTRKNAKKIIKAGVSVVHIKPKRKSNPQYIAESHECLREAAIKGKYDFLLHLESDVFPPSDVIQRLLVHQKPIVSAMYPIEFGHDSHLMLQNIEDRAVGIKHTLNITQGHDFHTIDGKLKQVYAVGLGCTLIHRDILPRFKFRWEKGANAHPDSFFAFDMKQYEIPQFLDTSILCEHRNSAWINF